MRVLLLEEQLAASVQQKAQLEESMGDGQAAARASTVRSLEQPIGRPKLRAGADTDTTLQQLISDSKPQPDELGELAMLRDDLEATLAALLTERERLVLRMRFGLADGRKHTLRAVGASLSVTRERIRQIETRALEKLRTPDASRKLREYLENDESFSP